MTPVASVVIVSDYAGGEEKAWDDIRATLRALAAQDFDEPVEYLLVERDSLGNAIPADLRALLPGLKIVLTPKPTAYDLQNEGAVAASADIVALLDADCIPEPSWLRVLVQSMRDHPEAAVVSGRTTYPGRSLMERILSLLDRAFNDPGRTVPTSAIFNNNCAYRRDVYRAHPIPNDAGPFGSRLQTEAIRRAGHRLLFEPAMHVTHDFEGWHMEKDIRRHLGFAVISIRRVDPKVPFGWLVRFGPLMVPFIVAYRILRCWGTCLRSGRYYGVAWYQLPVALGIGVIVHMLEVPGMLSAFRGKPIEATAYR